MKQNDLLMVNLKNDPQTALMLFNVLWQLVRYVKCMSVYESKWNEKIQFCGVIVANFLSHAFKFVSYI